MLVRRGVVNCVCSIQYPPVWRCLREELEWPLVDILQATSRLGLLLSSVGGGVRLSPVSAGEREGGGRGGGEEGGLNHCQATLQLQP